MPCCMRQSRAPYQCTDHWCNLHRKTCPQTAAQPAQCPAVHQLRMQQPHRAAYQPMSTPTQTTIPRHDQMAGTTTSSGCAVRQPFKVPASTAHELCTQSQQKSPNPCLPLAACHAVLPLSVLCISTRSRNTTKSSRGCAAHCRHAHAANNSVRQALQAPSIRSNLEQCLSNMYSTGCARLLTCYQQVHWHLMGEAKLQTSAQTSRTTVNAYTSSIQSLWCMPPLKRGSP